MSNCWADREPVRSSAGDGGGLCGRWAGRSSAACASATDGAGDIPVNRAAFRRLSTLPARLAGTGGRSRVRRILALGALAAGLALSACRPDAQAPGGEGEGGHERASSHDSLAQPVYRCDPCASGRSSQIRALSAYSRDPEQSSMDVALARRLRRPMARSRPCWRFIPICWWPAPIPSPRPVWRPCARWACIKRSRLPIRFAQSRAQVRDLAGWPGMSIVGEALVRQMTVPWPKPRHAGRPDPRRAVGAGRHRAGQATLVAELMARPGCADSSAQRQLGDPSACRSNACWPIRRGSLLAVGHARPHSERARLLFHPALAGARAAPRTPRWRPISSTAAGRPSRMLARLVAVHHQLKTGINRT